ncbi:Anaerobic nitric oxide reductase transcription regulator NorR [subsurface metagenome]
MIVLEDITQTERFWEKMAQAEKITSLGLLSAGMSHEIYNPLGAILSHVQYLSAVENNGEKLDSLKWIESKTGRIAEITERLLNFARIDHSRARSSNLNNVANETLELLKRELDKKKIRVSTDLKPDLLPVSLSFGSLEQVICNLIINAIQAVPTGGTIRISTARKSDQASFIIEDNGAGISKEDLRLIFNPFFSTKRDSISLRESLEACSLYTNLESLDPRMQEIDSIIGRIKDSPATVLILGESGTGNEITAKRIHYSGLYRTRPFIGVNCAALNHNLLESELFGHEKGAFTGAVSRKLGRFELAGSGSLFLDEIGDMSPAMQAKLLRVLQERNFERVGGTRTIRTDCRIIAASNQDLQNLISRGAFREDLYYRLSLIVLQIPPLRARSGDIEPLIDLFIQQANLE